MEPKNDYGDSSCVIEWIVENYLKIQDYPNAIVWVEKLGKYLKNKEIMGDWEFLKGKVYLEAGDFAKALDNFKLSYTKAKKDCFKEQDPKYWDFYKTPQKYVLCNFRILSHPIIYSFFLNN